MLRPILFFGASFNPPTKAHVALVEYMIAFIKDKNPRPLIVLAPVYKHRFSKPDLADFNARLKLTEIQFGDEIKQGIVAVSPIEEIVYKESGEVKSNPGTIDVLQYIKNHPALFPACDVNHISLMLGGDTYQDLMSGQWKDADKIIMLCDKIHIFSRAGLTPSQPIQAAKLDNIKTALKQKQSQDFGTQFILHQDAITDPDIQQISSTKVRKDSHYASQALTDKILNAIKTHFPDLF